MVLIMFCPHLCSKVEEIQVFLSPFRSLPPILTLCLLIALMSFNFSLLRVKFSVTVAEQAVNQTFLEDIWISNQK